MDKSKMTNWIQCIKKNKFLFYLAKKLQYKSIFSISSKKINGKGNRISISKKSMLFNVSIRIIGDNNSVSIDDDCVLERVSVFIKGNNNKIEISRKVLAHHYASWWIEDNNNTIYVGEHSGIGDAHLAVTEDNQVIHIGSNCIFAKGIEVRTGDSHSILDAISGKRINYAQNVTIGNNVWLGSQVSVLKGAIISDNSIVATRSVVTKPFLQKGILLAGIPAKVIKENIRWDKERI
jgi:acetyltransferase-like isoleucine patch superfamily enzyme